ANMAQLSNPYKVAVDPSGNLFIVDNSNNRIRIVSGAASSNQTPFVIPNLGSVSVTTSGSPSSLVSGYGRIQTLSGSTPPSSVAILDYRPNNILISEAVVAGSAPSLASRIYAEINNQVNTGIAIANPSDRAATVSFFLTDVAGNDLGSGTTTIAANGQ